MKANAVRLCWVLGLLMLAAGVALAAPKPDDGSKPEPPAERIRKAFEQNVSVDLQGLTLSAALEALREQTKVNFILDRSTAAQNGIVPDEMPVNLKMANVRLRTVMKNLLNQFNLSCVIDQDVVLVTTEQAAIDRQVRQRVSVDFDKVPLDTALRQLSKETNTNLVIDPRYFNKIRDSVTLRLDDVPLEIAVRLMAEMAGLRSVRQANVIFVTNREVALELRREEEASSATAPATPNVIDSVRPGGGPGVAPAAPPAPAPAAPANPPPAKPAEDKDKDKDKDK